MLRTILILGRVSNLPTVWTNVLAGWFLVGGAWNWELLWIEIGVSLLYIAGMTLNDAFDAKWDREHAPERPIPSGAISGGKVLALGAIQMLAGAAVLLTLTRIQWPWLACLVAAIVIYDAVHKRTPVAVLVMGACRGLVYLMAASAISRDGYFPHLLWVLAGTVVAYVAGITVLARSERGPDAPRWEKWLGRALVYAPLFALAIAPGEMTDAEGTWIKLTLWIVSLVFVIGWITIVSTWFLKSEKGLAIALLIAGITIIDGSVVWFSDSIAGMVALALLPITLLFQRFIPAT
ncbi:MAG: UbiA family prenyltransferase [Verrucomicrobiae bacterium]|nr:UbiA family prenyltransferase [Verrucomicrobiae bacterium]